MKVNPNLVECLCGATGLAAGLIDVCNQCKCSTWNRKVCVCRECFCEPSTMGSIRRRDYTVDPVCFWIEDGLVHMFETYMEHEHYAKKIPMESTSVLGRSLVQFAPCIAALNDLEEMVLSLIHPLVQVYSIPRTGELAYVGHICNFRQDVKRFMKSLPVCPADMPFVLIKPRAHRSQEKAPRMPFPVDTSKLRAAFEWLTTHNYITTRPFQGAKML